MLCLGIESSCDDTSLALVQDGVCIAEKSISQAGVHALFGGVVPEVASREHGRAIAKLCRMLFEEVSLDQRAVDVVSVARGPGLLGSLLVGVSFAKAFARASGASILGINHLHAHLLVNGLEGPLEFPALGLLVSGGHTHIYRMDGVDLFSVLGKTIDDAAGEAFDKGGKMLGLPYPAGKFIDSLAQAGHADWYLFPRPYVDNNHLNFSFSGLKTALAVYVQKQHIKPLLFNPFSTEPVLPENQEHYQILADICASYTAAIVETLTIKVERAIIGHPDCRHIYLAGGVACNTALRESMLVLGKKHGIEVHFPSPALCTDNGAMIAYAGYLLAKQGYRHSLDFSCIPRGKEVPWDMWRKASGSCQAGAKCI